MAHGQTGGSAELGSTDEALELGIEACQQCVAAWPAGDKTPPTGSSGRETRIKATRSTPTLHWRRPCPEGSGASGPPSPAAPSRARIEGSSLFQVGERLYVIKGAVEPPHLVHPHGEPDHAPANREPEPAPVPGPSAPPGRRRDESVHYPLEIARSYIEATQPSGIMTAEWRPLGSSESASRRLPTGYRTLIPLPGGPA